LTGFSILSVFAMMIGMQEDIARILFHETTILRRLDEMASSITEDYRNRDLTVIAVMNGSVVFLADLLRRIPLPLQVDAISVASYHGTSSTGKLRFRQTELPDVSGRHVLLLDDILDSGLTLSSIVEKFRSFPGVKSVSTCVLLAKEVPRPGNLQADYVGFSIGNEFVVGYGLDYNEHYRNLPYVGVLTPEAIERYACKD
jgi:hypoxanthine phosphoribosyltransferase